MENNIRRLRLDKGMTQKELGKLVGCSAKMISHWENNRRVPSLEYVLKLANVLDLDVEELFKEE